MTCVIEIFDAISVKGYFILVECYVNIFSYINKYLPNENKKLLLSGFEPETSSV